MDILAYIQSGIIESYVLGLASAEESAELETLRFQFPEIEAAILEFSDLLEQQAFENAISPSLDVKSKIMAAIKEEKNFAPVVALPVSDNINAGKVSSNLRFLRMVAAASVILFVVSAGLNFYLYNQYNQKNNAYQALLSERNNLEANNQIYQTRLQQLQTAAKVMADPDMKVVKMPGIAGKEGNFATVYWNVKKQELYIMPNNLPQPAKGKQFQLWALVDGKPVDAGLLDAECQGVCKMKNVPKAQAFAITLENAGGSPTPTMEQMYVLGKV